MKTKITFIISLLFTTISYAANFSADFKWLSKHRCSSTSPEFNLIDIPEGTIDIAVTLNDLDMRSFDHGGGRIRSETPLPSQHIIAEGSLKNYRGPCPPNFGGAGHDYEFVFTARDSSGKILGKTIIKKNFSSKSVE
jgi:phosphatidylethanolamine-binding protein (PEBP) family uncharacterized protein